MSQLSSNGGRPPVPGEALPVYPKQAPAQDHAQGEKSSPAQAATPTQYPSHSTAEDGIPATSVLVVALLLGLFWCVIADAEAISLILVLMGGAGVSLAALAFMVAAALFASRPDTLWSRLSRLDGYGRALMVITVLLCLVPAFTTSLAARALNAPLMALACAMTYRVLSGRSATRVIALGGALGSVGFFLRSQFAHMGKAFAVSRGASKNRNVLPALAGLVAAGTVLTVVLPLLAEVDPTFAKLLDSIEDALSSLSLTTWSLRAARFALITLMAFSLLFTMTTSDGKQHDAGSSFAVASKPTAGTGGLPNATVATMLFIMNLVYAVFIAIQLQLLVRGGLDPAESSQYSSSAREGFFQLVAVSFINLTMLAACMWRKGAAKFSVVQVLELMLLACTALVLASAVLRMNSYVNVYGLTQLRSFTYLAIVCIAVLLVLFALKILRPQTELFKTSALAVCTLWLAFALTGPDARIAWYNVNGYLDGSISTLDVEYLVEDLSWEAKPAFESLRQHISKYNYRYDEVMSYDHRYMIWPFYDYDGSSCRWQYASIPQLVGSLLDGSPGTRTPIV